MAEGGYYKRYLSSSLASSLRPAKGKLYLPRQQEDNKSYKTLDKTEHQVLPVLFGWALSGHKALAKYAAVYNELGLPAVCVTPSLPSLWFSGLGYIYTAKIFQTISKNVTMPTSIVLHLFSGAPSVALPFVTTNLPSNLRLQAVIFDSLVLFREHAGIAAAKQALDLGAMNLASYYVAVGVGKTVHTLLGKEKREQDEESRKHPTMDVPQLFLYSEADSVAKHEEVEEVIDEQIKFKRLVEKFQWKDSSHVRHLIKYPEEYRSNISTFLRKYNVL